MIGNGRAVCSLLLLMLLAACASAPISKYEENARNFKVPEGQALLYLYREGIGGIVGYDQVSIDGKRSLEVSDDGYYVIELSPGEHTIEHGWVAMGVSLGAKHTRKIQMQAGKLYWLNFWSLDTLGHNTESYGDAVSDINSLDFLDYYVMSSSSSDAAKLKETEAQLHKTKAQLQIARQTSRAIAAKPATGKRVKKSVSAHRRPVKSRHSGASARPDDATVFRRTLAAAIRGETSAQYRVGSLYDQGIGVEKDGANAVHWYRMAAEKGNIPAQVRLGFMYRFGDGIKQDNEEAFKWYYLASTQDSPEAHFYLGLQYDAGLGVRRDHDKAMALYLKAAEHGFALAQLYLGEMYSRGTDVEKDDGQAVKWYLKAANQRMALAQFKVGEAYANGRGVEKNAAAATDWFYKAGMTYLKQGKRNDALRSAERIQKLKEESAAPNSQLGDELMHAIDGKDKH